MLAAFFVTLLAGCFAALYLYSLRPSFTVQLVATLLMHVIRLACVLSGWLAEQLPRLVRLLAAALSPASLFVDPLAGLL